MYNEFAQVYDELMGDVNYEQWTDYLYRLLLNAPKEVKTILEFGSGTGNLTTRLAKKGFDMTAVDISEDMLTIADEKADREGLDINFYLGDMSSFVINDKFDAVISACDTVNYLDDLDKIAGFIEGAYDALNPGGVLLFDINTITKFKKTIGDNTFVYNLEDVYCVWESQADENRVDYDLTFFTKGEDGRYDRHEESQSQYAYEVRDIYQILKDTGFKDIKVYNFGSFLAGTDEHDRLQIWAQKP